MDKVRIFVVAGSNQGKTTIAHIIKEALDAHGFQKVILSDTKVSGVAKQPIEQRVQATKERPVLIEVLSFDNPTHQIVIPVK
jgi:UDP-N-acetylmuramoylalanine-D-glutamate ligase